MTDMTCTREEQQKLSLDEIPKGVEPPVSYPLNCSHPCCYGKGQPFCFPCYLQILRKG